MVDQWLYFTPWWWPQKGWGAQVAGSGLALAAEEDTWLLSCIYSDSHTDHTPFKNGFDLNDQVECCVLGHNKSHELAGVLHSHKYSVLTLRSALLSQAVLV